QSNISFTLTGLGTHFLQGSTQVNLGAGINVTSVNVASSTSLTAVINIAPNAYSGLHGIEVTTGGEVVWLTYGLTVQPGSPAITLVNPGNGQQGQQNLAVTITGQFTHFSSSSVVTFSGTGIT